MDVPQNFLGSSKLKVSRIGLGTAALGRPGYINEGHHLDLEGKADRSSMEHNMATVLDAAYQAGVTYIDAARSYGEAENFLRSWLDSSAAPRPDVVVGSKWGYTYVADWKINADVHEVKDHSSEAFIRQSAETEQSLGDYLDLYQIHSVTPESPVFADAETLDRLAELKAQGVLIGFSTSGPDQATTIRKALECMAGSQLLFDTVQSTWNVLEPSAGEALAEASDAGLGVIIKEAVANGRLTHRGDYAEKLEGGDYSPDARAIASVLAQPFVSTVLSGATTVEQLRSNLDAVRAEPVDDIDPIDPVEYWTQRSNRSWT